MIVDSSALVAVVLDEPRRNEVVARLTGDDVVRVGAPTLVETGIVLTARLGVPGKTLLARLVQEAEIEVIPLGAEHWTVAVDAYVRFGKGRHSAALNFGDCLTYAVARVSDEPLLCLGDDFPQTDVRLVLTTD